MTHPTPTAPHPITVHLRNYEDEVIGSAAIRLVLTAPGQATDPAAWAITHPLGSIANATHTEVAFVDDTTDALPVRTIDAVVRQVAAEVYGRAWAFMYAPDRVESAVLRHGSLLRERVEVSAVQVWA